MALPGVRIVKHLLLVLLFLPRVVLGATCTPTDVYSTAVCVDNPDHYLRMDATSGTTETDNGVNPFTTNVMTYAGGYTLNQTGALIANGNTNRAVAFNGTTGVANRANDGVSPPSSCGPSYTNNQGWALEVWVYITANVGGTQFTVVMSSANPPGSNNSVMRVTINGSQKINFQMGDGTSGSVFFTNSGTTAATNNTWYQVGVTTVGSGSNHLSSMKIYRNAVLNYDAGSYSATALLNCNSLTDMSIGATPGAQQPYTGNIDEYSIYPTNIGQTRLLAHYNAAVTAGTGNSWPFLARKPSLPHFTNGDYFTQFVARGYNTGHFTFREIQPQLLNVAYPNFAVMPWGNVGRR